MSDSDLSDLDANSGDSKKKGLPLIPIIAGVVALVLGGGGAGLYFSGLLDGLLGKKPADEAAETAHGDDHGGKDAASHDTPKKEEPPKDDHAKKDDGHGKKDDGHSGGGGTTSAGGLTYTGEPGAYFLKMPDMIVNLNTDGNAPRFLRLAVQLEIADEGDVQQVIAVMPRVVDQFQTYLRELRVRDLRGSAGIYRLQIELLKRVNRAASPAEVKDVLFQEILIQ